MNRDRLAGNWKQPINNGRVSLCASDRSSARRCGPGSKSCETRFPSAPSRSCPIWFPADVRRYVPRRTERAGKAVSNRNFTRHVAMTTSSRFLKYILAFLLAFLPGCAGTPKRRRAPHQE